MIGRALRDAGLLADYSDDQIQDKVIDLFGYNVVGFEPVAEYARVLQLESLSDLESAQVRSDALSDNITQAVALVWSGPVLERAGV